MADAALKTSTTEARLASLDMPTGGWSQTARKDALSRVIAMGLPERKDEYWRYTRPDSLTQPGAIPAALFHNDESPLFGEVERIKIVFVDGVFDADASDDLTLEGLTIERLAEANTDIHWARDLYGVLETNGQTPVHRPLAALNTAFATDGVLIHVTGKVSKPINLQYHHRSETSDAILHHVIRVDTGAEVTILESGPAAARFNKVMEVDVADQTGVFQGKILVKEGAQKTDGYQISQSLLLDDDSQFLAKPELEIYADDVACSHGSTSGAIDETALFYLRSRGIPHGPATDLLTLAFLAEAVDEIEDETLRAEIVDRLAGWLERHRK